MQTSARPVLKSDLDWPSSLVMAEYNRGDQTRCQPAVDVALVSVARDGTRAHVAASEQSLEARRRAPSGGYAFVAMV